ncbi:hypothetical protein EV641_107196 [Rhodococcus sp. SMB37]|nr:hypothetical protein EV641_107196 [Rhodococcus sp. SMB37]
MNRTAVYRQPLALWKINSPTWMSREYKVPIILWPVLTEPVEVRRPAFFEHTRATASVSRLSLQVDDPGAVAAQLRAEQSRPGRFRPGA